MRKKQIEMKKEDALQWLGNANRTADYLGIAASAISIWPDPIPEKDAWALNYISRGRIPCVIHLERIRKAK